MQPERVPMFFRLLWIFFLYSFAGWVIETTVAIIKQKRFVNRGVLNGPLCTIYGVAAVVLSVTQRELLDNIPLLFVFSAIYATVIEWLAGYFLEKTNHGKWWDYSKIPLNLDGYICLPYSLLWGVLGVVAVKWINPFVYALYDWIPRPVTTVILWVLLGIFAIGRAGHLLRDPTSQRHFFCVFVEANNRLAGFTRRFGNAIANLIQRRLTRAHPQIQERAVQGPPGRFCARVQLLQDFYFVCSRQLFGRHHRNDLLPDYGRRVDEPKQSGVGTVQRGMGPGFGRRNPADVFLPQSFR